MHARTYAATKTEPVGNVLEAMLKVEVVREGNGLTMGTTSSMMKFLDDDRPFIGTYTHVCMHGTFSAQYKENS